MHHMNASHTCITSEFDARRIWYPSICLSSMCPGSHASCPSIDASPLTPLLLRPLSSLPQSTAAGTSYTSTVTFGKRRVIQMLQSVKSNFRVLQDASVFTMFTPSNQDVLVVLSVQVKNPKGVKVMSPTCIML